MGEPSGPGLGRVDGGEEHKLPLLEDIMQLAMRGEIIPIQKLLDEGKAQVNHKDHEGITHLHVGAAQIGSASRP